MADQYTHNFKFQMADGGVFVEGKVEFNTDGKMSYKIESTSQPLPKEALTDFTELMDLCHSLFNKYEGLKLIKIVDKEAE